MPNESVPHLDPNDNTRILIVVAGYYKIEWMVALDGTIPIDPPATRHYTFAVRQNNTIISTLTATATLNHGNGNAMYLTCSGIFQLLENQTIALHYVNNAGAVPIPVPTWHNTNPAVGVSMTLTFQFPFIVANPAAALVNQIAPTATAFAASPQGYRSIVPTRHHRTKTARKKKSKHGRRVLSSSSESSSSSGRSYSDDDSSSNDRI
jgi:hypothetical protein